MGARCRSQRNRTTTIKTKYMIKGINIFFTILFTMAIMGHDEEFGFLRYWAWFIIALLGGLTFWIIKMVVA